MTQRKIRMGMVGGGRGAFIGAVHRIAAAIDQQIELVCGAFSSTPEKSMASGADYFLPSDRCYGTFHEMIETEKLLVTTALVDSWGSNEEIVFLGEWCKPYDVDRSPSRRSSAFDWSIPLV